MTATANKSKYTALFLGWLVPGLGHSYAGKTWQAGVFFVALYASAIAGLWMGGFRNVYFMPDHYQFYAEIGNGFLTLAVSLVMRLAHVSPTEATAHGATLAGSLPIADLYLMVAGLLNFVVAANAFDAVARENRAA